MFAGMMHFCTGQQQVNGRTQALLHHVVGAENLQPHPQELLRIMQVAPPPRRFVNGFDCLY
jgi:hypothetical protein